MSFKEISYLRKEGQLEDAYKMAVSEYNQDPQDNWTMSALFWVLRDLCLKVFIPNKKSSELDKALNLMNQLLSRMDDDEGIASRSYEKIIKRIQPEAELISEATELSKSDPVSAYNKVYQYIVESGTVNQSLHEELGWIIYRYLKSNFSTLDSLESRKNLKLYLDLNNDRPSLLHSSIINIALNLSKANCNFKFYKFFLSWGPENLRRDDLTEGYYQGKKTSSLLSRIIKTLVDTEDNINVEELCSLIQQDKTKILELLRENIFWKLINFQKEGNIENFIVTIKKYALEYCEFGASHWHSEIIKIAERFLKDKNSLHLIEFMRLIGYNSFQKEDWLEQKGTDGNTYKSLTDKLGDRLFDYIKDQYNKDEEILDWAFNFYTELISNTVDNEWVKRKQAIIATWLNKYTEAEKIYKQLVIELGDKYYIWSEMANCIHNNDCLKISLLSKALLLEKNENFLGDIRLSMAELLFRNNKEVEALTELAQYKKKREEEGWRVSNKYEELIIKIDSSISPDKNNYKLYHEYASKAEEYAYSEIESKKVVLVEKWEKDKNIYCNMSDGDAILLVIKSKRFPILNSGKIGDVYEVKYSETVELIESGARLNNKTSRKNVKYTPLVVKKISMSASSILSQRYGYVENISEDRVFIVSQDSKNISCLIKDIGTKINKNDFIIFNQYHKANKDGCNRYYGLNIKPVNSIEAIEYFSKCLVVVDNVNNKKELIHYVSGDKNIDGVIFFNNTNIRPDEGDTLKITYYVKANKEGVTKCHILKVESTDEIATDLIKEFKGNLELKYNKYSDCEDEPSFAFVGDYYIPKYILNKYNITSDCSVEGIAVRPAGCNRKVIKLTYISK